MQWTTHDLRVRRLREFDGEQLVEHQRWKCKRCRKVVTAFDDRVVPYFLYSRAVIRSALARRLDGATWERVGASCTADGQVDPSLAKRWQRRFAVVDGCLVEKQPPSVHFSARPGSEILLAPVGSWSPDPLREDHWARSPPPQP